MKIIACIQARMESKRFPGKVMADLCGKPVLQHVIDQTKKIDVDDVFLLTADTEENKALISLAVENEIKFNYYGFKELQCLYWYYSTAVKSGADYIVRVCGDSPFIDFQAANTLIAEITDQFDYYSFLVNGNPAILSKYGIFTEIFAVDKLKAMFEHVTPGYYTHFRQLLLPIKMPHDYKLSIDKPIDLERCSLMIYLNQNKIPGYKEIERIIEQNPELKYQGDMQQTYEWSK